MKTWIILVLLSVLLSSPALSVAADNTFDSGRATMFSYPFVSVPLDGSSSDSNASKGKKGEEPSEIDAQKQKEIRDKKVDDAIKKAWGEK